MHTIHLVASFHAAFDHPISAVPTVPSVDTRLLRFRLILEELMEFGRAIGVKRLAGIPDEEFQQLVKDQLKLISIDETAPVDLIEAADALGDIDYVVQGSNLVFGFPAEAIIAEIHSANMSKLGEDGRPIKDAYGKIVKGPNTRKPDIGRLLQAHGSELRPAEEDAKLYGPR